MSHELKTPLRVPESLGNQLLAFRRRVWTIKLTEAIAIAALGIGIAFLCVYVWDRLHDMPAVLRGATLLAAVALTGFIPWFAYRWVWKYRALEPLARLLGKKLPAIGDPLLGVIELTHSDSEQARSPALCRAAMRQVAKEAGQHDFAKATPPSRYRTWASLATVTGLIAGSIVIMYPAASASAWSRLVMPWRDVPRYTFTRLQQLPEKIVVAHGEAATLPIQLSDDSRWQPPTGELTIGQQPTLQVEMKDGEYAFPIPPQINRQAMTLRIGDVTQQLRLEPTLRPELSSIIADIQLPSYLGRPDPQQVDLRGGSVSIVRGSEAIFTATANRELASGQINDEPREPTGSTLSSKPIDVESVQSLKFQWEDQFGLAGRDPFALSINAREDETPTLICDGLSRQAVVLDSETLKFSVHASDDFGIRRVGMMWRGLPAGVVDTPAKGERPLAAGDHESSEMDVMGTFSAKSLGIQPQPIELFVWAEDYLPNRPRVYSPPHILYILTPDQHAIWMTEQLSKWHRQALGVRDKERQLYEQNKELRALSANELDATDNRRRVERQASAERANGRRLGRLGELGDDLIRTASRNPEIGVGHLERWAEMLQVLRDLSQNRMPSVADLLDGVSEQPTKIANGPPSKSGPIAGQIRSAKAGAPSEPSEGPAPKLRSAPQLVDMESSMNSPDEEPGSPGAPKQPSSPALRLPVTTVMGKSQPKGDDPPKNQEDSLQQAVIEQEDLLAEFDRLADELNAVLANLEGSTLVKRLKAASRHQNLVATRLTGQLQHAFGLSKPKLKTPVRDTLSELKESEHASTQNVSYIMDDLSAYFQRRRFMRFKAVLDEMKSTDVIGGLRQLADEIPTQQGMSVAQCEYWSDSMDRWAENLVDPACSGTCPGGKSPESLPPSIVLEVLQILEAEVNLRDETRVAEQARAAVDETQHEQTANALSETQATLNERIVKVIARIGELADSQKHFGKELAMLAQVDQVMTETTELLSRPETGSPAIAAETEVIELLLRSKRINPNGGGGGGASPGGGGTGNTTDSALALLGKGTNQKEVRQDHGITQTTGETGVDLPEEYRSGLDKYFSRLGGS